MNKTLDKIITASAATWSIATWGTGIFAWAAAIPATALIMPHLKEHGRTAPILMAFWFFVIVTTCGADWMRPILRIAALAGFFAITREWGDIGAVIALTLSTASVVGLPFVTMLAATLKAFAVPVVSISGGHTC